MIKQIPPQYRIIFLALLFGLFGWISDAAIDSIFFHSRDFTAALITGLSVEEILLRAAIIACFLIFGLIISYEITKRDRTAEILQQSERKFREFFENDPEFCYMISPDGIIMDVNKTALAALAYTREELVGKPFEIIYPSDQQNKAVDIFSLWKKSGGKLKDIEMEIVSKTGNRHTVLLSATSVTDKEGKLLHSISVQRDITERKRTEEKLKKLQNELKKEKQKLEQVLNIDQRISSILQLNNLVDFVIENATKILNVEKCSLMLLDEDTQELQIRAARGLNAKVIKETRVKLGAPIAGQVVQEGEPLLVNDIETHHYLGRANRATYRSKSFMSVPIKVQNKLVGVVNIADKKVKTNGGSGTFNTTDLKILTSIVHQAAISIENANNYRRLELLSTTDPLTGIYNQRFFLQMLDKEIKRCERYPKPMCLLMVDIDNFKSYNDSFGHLEGDLLLKEVANVLRHHLRSVDTFCRYGGDEFLAVLPETAPHQAEVVAQKIKSVISELRLRRKISVSIGIAGCKAGFDRQDFISRADQALYIAKKEGKNRIAFAS